MSEDAVPARRGNRKRGVAMRVGFRRSIPARRGLPCSRRWIGVRLISRSFPFMGDFPAFMKHPANRVATASQYTEGIEGYVFDGADGSQMAFWRCESDAITAEHVHVIIFVGTLTHRGCCVVSRRAKRSRCPLLCLLKLNYEPHVGNLTIPMWCMLRMKEKSEILSKRSAGRVRSTSASDARRKRSERGKTFPNDPSIQSRDQGRIRPLVLHVLEGQTGRRKGAIPCG
jgi:hypothetical protein